MNVYESVYYDIRLAEAAASRAGSRRFRARREPCNPGSARRRREACRRRAETAALRIKILDFGGFDSNIILLLRGGILTNTHTHTRTNTP